jgi:hypothetical protein
MLLQDLPFIPMSVLFMCLDVLHHKLGIGRMLWMCLVVALVKIGPKGFKAIASITKAYVCPLPMSDIDNHSGFLILI